MDPHPLTLRFPSAPLEAAFHADYVRRSLVLVRLSLLLGIAMYAGYGLLDRWMVPVATGQVRAVRVAVCAVIALALASTYAPRLIRRWMQAVVVTAPVVAGVGVAVMAWMAQASEVYHHYHAGVMVPLIYLHVLLRTRFVYAAAGGTLIVAAYLAAVAATAIPTPMLANSAFFLVTTHLSGMVASYALERYARLEFLHARRQARTNRELAGALDGLRAAQARLIQQEKLASLGRLAAGVAHEIKNPLNFVTNFAEVNRELLGELRAELGAAPERPAGEALAATAGLLDDLDRNTARIREHGGRADAIVDAMQAHARGRAGGSPVPTDLNALVEAQAALAGLAPGGPPLRLELDPAVGLVPCEPEGMGRVLRNLLANALHAVGDRARRAAGGDGAYVPSVVVRTRRGPGAVRIEVEDNGAGIAPAAAERVFEPFYTTKAPGEGSGLGLSLAYEIVGGHGGALTFTSEEGRGSTFVVTLPAPA